jgi:hypothetical protein
MANRPAFKNWLAILMKWRSYWSERLGALFKVGENTDLAVFDVKIKAFSDKLQEIEDSKSHTQDLCAERNVMADELYTLLGNLKSEVGIAKGKNSPEYKAAPRLTQPPAAEADETSLGPPPGTTPTG